MEIEMIAITTERKAFDEKHGKDGIVIGELLQFSDGARRTLAEIPEYYEPPRDKYELAELHLQYEEAVLERRVKEFNEFRDQLISAATASRREKNYPFKNRRMPELKELLKKVREAQARVKTAEEALGAATPDEDIEAERQEAENVRAAEDMLAALAQIKI
jgi:hypothetical protein